MPNVFTIAPHAPFLKVLAEKLLAGALVSDWPMDAPFALSDVTIFLPTKRARTALIEELARQKQGALLLPQIKTLGEEDSDEAAFFDPDFPGPAATHPAARQLALAQLIAAWVKAEDPGGRFGFAGAIDHLALGASLGRLIDDFEIEEADRAKLASIVPDNLAANWQETLKFLSIVLEAWPRHLDEHGLADHARLRRERIDRECENLVALYGERPVIAAGSTGSIPATAKLIAAISKLERGAVVLPGLDTGLDVKALTDPRKGDAHRHAHPQYGMAQLLTRYLKIAPKNVVELGGDPTPRTQALRQALALAEGTEGWAADRGKWDKAAEGLSLAMAPTPHEEARAIALAARKALHDGKTVGIISPDRDLARRIAQELKRFGIEIEDGAGTPLALSRAARLMRQALLVVSGKWGPVDVAALLSAPPVRLGLKRAEIARLQALLELVALRGQGAGGVSAIRKRIAANLARQVDHPMHKLDDAEAAALSDLIDRMEAALKPVIAAFAGGAARPAVLAGALRQTLAALRASEEEVPALDGESELNRWLVALEAAPIAPPIRADVAAESLIALMAGESVSPKRPGRADIAIWGRIEARLQTADFIIAAGLNEAAWPGEADPGPWLSRQMRIDAGLEPPERRTGLAAHDFEMALGAREVLLTASERIGTSPADRSRFLQRLEGFFGADISKQMRRRGAKWIAQAEAIDRAEEVTPAARPAPRPEALLRPRKLSVTDVEKLIRDPYAIYAKYVLGLRKLDALGEPPEAALRGTLIHAAFGKFIIGGGEVQAKDAHDRLMALADAEFAALGDIGDKARLWRERFRRMAEEFLDWERKREGVAARRAEIEGAFELAVTGGTIKLNGRADRIDRRTDGQVEIVDFKTGTVPAPKQIREFLAPQLPVEALMARAGGFDDLAAAEAARLIYVKLAHGPEALKPTEFEIKGVALGDVIAQYEARLKAHVEALLFSDTQALHPRLLPPASTRYAGDYDHLSRFGEWDGEGEADE